MKKYFLLLFAVFFPMVASADAVEINGIYYELILKAQQAEVTRNPNNYSGDILIPESVTYDGTTYSVTSIGTNAFWACNEITTVTIPNSVTSICDGAFWICSALTSVNIGSGVTGIGELAFSECSSLTTINIPDNVKNIGKKAFFRCNNLTSVSIGSGVSKIDEWTFGECISLSSISIGNNVTTIGMAAFAECNSLQSLNIPNSVTLIDDAAFHGCSSLEILNIGSGITTINYGCFSGCSSLASVIIPNSVTTVRNNAFKECSGMTSLTIGSGVETIAPNAFADCKQLTDVFCLALVLPWTGDDVFKGSYIEYVILHVPSSVINDYKKTKPWSEFKEIVGIAMPEHELKYIVDDEIYKTCTVEEGTAITPEPAPTKEGYTFSGWSEIPAVMPAHDVTITGTFTINSYTLTYMVDDEVYKTYELKYGTDIIPEEAPQKTGYTFSGWSDIPSAMPAKDITISGTFIINSYKLTYVVDGVEYKTFAVEYDSAIIPEEKPTKEGHTFSGWSEIPETMPANDVTVTGSFIVNKYQVTYIIDGEVFSTEYVEYGATIVPPIVEEKEGFTFSGWAEVPESMPAHDITIYGNFTSGIAEIVMATKNNMRIYSPNGKKINKLLKGLNIVVLEDGSVKKIVVK